MRCSVPTFSRKIESAKTMEAEHWRNADELRWTVRRWAVRIGISAPYTAIRPMRARWASVSTAGRLTLNTEILELPRRLGEYVVVHELVHLLAPNHGPLHQSFL